MKNKLNISWFSIIEVMIAIFIFSMGMASIFMVINSSINLNTMNKNQILASNLSREWIEIIKNIRDTNYKTFHKYNWIPNSLNDFDNENYFSTWTYYKVENDFNSSKYPFLINEIIDFAEGPLNVNTKMQDYRLYIDDKKHYTHDNLWNSNTVFYRFIEINELIDWNWDIIEDALKIKSKVIWYSKWYHDFEINTILTDFNRL